MTVRAPKQAKAPRAHSRVSTEPVLDPGGHRAMLRLLVGEGAWLDGVADGAPIDDKRLIRRARRIAHPDRHDGDRTMWDRVQVAAEALAERQPLTTQP